MVQTVGYAAHSETTPLTPFSFNRREVGPKDVAIEITHCGICHSDLHQIKDDWGFSQYPMVPGHEIVGKVIQVGSEIQKFSVGQKVGVGCLVDSCQECPSCKDNEEQFCEQGSTQTYNGLDKHLGGMTYGGYSKLVVVDENFVLSMPEHLPTAASAPLLCAGITTYSPLKAANINANSKVGIVGLGGLGHVAVKIAAAMGATVCVISRTKDKLEDAKKLGATDYLALNDGDSLTMAAGSFDFILDTVSAKHDINTLLNLLKPKATLTQVGLPSEPLTISVFPFIFKKINFTGSLIGGIAETQEMLDFCGQHNITADIELLPMEQVNEALIRLENSDVKYRFVLDIENWQPEA
jgi:uncharacterized zinc-type alcohol dehydrogenase-like protein